MLSLKFPRIIVNQIFFGDTVINYLKESFIFIERMKPKLQKKKKRDKHFSLNIYIILSNNLTQNCLKGFSQSSVFTRVFRDAHKEQVALRSP